MDQERVFLDEEDTYVSNSRVSMGGTVYSTANLTSVSMRRIAPSQGCAIVLIVLGSLGLLLGFLVAEIDAGLMTTSLVAGLGALVAGFFWLRSLKPDYVVVLSSASGESEGLTSKDENRIQRVVGAIQEAMVARG